MAKPRDEAVDNRMFKNMRICMKCNARMKTTKVEKTKCRKCGAKSLRLKSKQIKGAK